MVRISDTTKGVRCITQQTPSNRRIKQQNDYSATTNIFSTSPVYISLRGQE